MSANLDGSKAYDVAFSGSVRVLADSEDDAVDRARVCCDCYIEIVDVIEVDND